MSLVTPYINKLEKIKTSIPRVATRSLINNAELIIKTLQIHQLSQGKDAYGKVVGVYKPSTEGYYADDPYKEPRKPKIAFTPYNFEWFGGFFDGMNLKVDTQKMTFEIFTTDYIYGMSVTKDKFLERQYGTDLMSLTKGNEQWVIENVISPAIIDYINSEMAKL